MRFLFSLCTRLTLSETVKKAKGKDERGRCVKVSPARKGTVVVFRRGTFRRVRATVNSSEHACFALLVLTFAGC